MTGFVTLMQQGGLIMWLLFIVALLQIYLFMQRWLTWPSLNWLPTASSQRPQLLRRAEHLLALNQLEKGLPLLKALVVITPLLGLTGTVTGMMLVFDGLSLGEAADPRRLSSGIARAILPTFASMAVVLLGMFFLSFWQRRARKTLQGH
ncbi:MotA/TolQ/ExbB proton channel family protein [Marinospirillum minutulum]|uniref:MotA/TolQ/ExbB proton channel family protein n=1 Tax=Marinospirillum minutulum TaxID=64974 RepID=UPI000413EDDF|nr:MotA/TolQ/ExbB proton channel family protein [Marinospirillum minutulum]